MYMYLKSMLYEHDCYVLPLIKRKIKIRIISQIYLIITMKIHEYISINYIIFELGFRIITFPWSLPPGDEVCITLCLWHTEVTRLSVYTYPCTVHHSPPQYRISGPSYYSVLHKMPRVRPKYELCVGFDEEDVSENEDGEDEGGDVGEEGEFDIQQVWQQMKQEVEDRTRAKENQTARAGAIQENNKKAKQRSSFLNWKQKIQVSVVTSMLFYQCSSLLK